MHSRFRVRNVETNADLTDHLEVHLLELPKRAGDGTLSPALRRWARFFDHPSEADLAQLAAEDDVMADTVKKLWAISDDDRHFYLAESRRKGEIRAQLDLTDARRQGAEEERVALARRMLGEGLDRALVARVLGLTEDELAALLAT